MPTYAYRCTTCGKTFDVFQPISAAPLEVCPESVCSTSSAAGRGKVERIISGGAGLIFNGSGFYITDYKRSSSTEESSKASASCSNGNCGCNDAD
ncbi:MAG: zinc ribbon domain-containing protein [Chlorobiota bacterium]|nr:MAG: zinc ribbon domain-containing protein [Chlorobiota bacterium]